MIRHWILRFLIVLFTAIPIHTVAQEPSPPKASQSVQYPHAKIYYHNGDSIVLLNLALDELVLESDDSAPIDTVALRSLGSVTVADDESARVRLSIPSTDIAPLNARAQALKTSTQRPKAVVYGDGMTARDSALSSVLTHHAIVKPTAGTSIDSLATSYGFKIVKQLLPNDTIYEIQAGADSLLAGLELANTLHESGMVEYAQPALRRAVELRRTLNDTSFAELWHLRNTRNDAPFIAGNDAGLTGAWDQVTGSGVNILVVDSGVAVAHPDLSPNARTDIDIDILDSDSDPTPIFSSHGTNVAGVAAAKGDNALGVAGAAFDASIVGVRLVDANPTDPQIVSAMSYLNSEPVVANQSHINTNSWGPSDSSASVKEALTPAMEAALLDGVTNGRNGKGVVYVWAAGNGRTANQNINYDGFSSSRFTIAVGASGGDGKYSYYSEPGASMLVTAPSSFGQGASARGIWSTTGSNAYSLGSFGGTSSSAPLVAGVVALMLEANPTLTWRDVQKILVATAVKIDLADAGWVLNSGGYFFNHNYGFGRVHAANAVLTANSWTNMPPLLPPLTVTRTTPEAIPDNSATGISQAVSISSASSFRAEQVELTVNITHAFRGDLTIVLTSPSGMRSVFTSTHNDSADDYSNWKFTSVAHFAENPVGLWTLRVSDGNPFDSGVLNNWTLRIHGSSPHQVAVPTMTVPFF